MARRRRNRTGRWLALVVVAAGGGTVGYWYWFAGHPEPTANLGKHAAVPLASQRPETAPLDGGPYADVPERGKEPDTRDRQPRQDLERGRALVASGRKAAAAGQLVTARAQLNEALEFDLPLTERVQLRGELTQLARQTVFGNAILQDDPFVEAYVIRPGDTLGKIAKQYQVTDEFLAGSNGIADKNRIRDGQRIKVVRGPFHAVVRKADYVLEVYLGNTFVRQYPVGLGAESSTPSGKWVVENKLKNPQYYPARGGQIILADDPDNPLGERWIGLRGTEGDAVGQERYGIHGTIEPDSIGRSASMGCIRMHNADVEEFYDLVVVNHSAVTVE